MPQNTTIQEISDRDSDVDPEGPAALAVAVDVEFQLSSSRNALEQMLNQQRMVQILLRNKPALEKAFDDAQKLDCSSTATEATLKDDIALISQTVSLYYQASRDIQKTQDKLLPQMFGNWWTASISERCSILQADSTKISVESIFKYLDEVDQIYSQKISTLKGELGALRDRLRKLLAIQAISTVTRNLPLLIGIIAGSAILIILVVRIFHSELQMEWVASGQVIQFTTVMILLSALMALGLTGILHEQVLGTLLGGIAGYVLAQGVGRATARATFNAANAAPSTPAVAAAAAAGAAAAAVPIAAAAMPAQQSEINGTTASAEGRK